MSIKNLVKKGKIVDLSILLRAVTEGPKAFDFNRLLNHPTETYFYATSALDALKVRFHIGKAALNLASEAADDGYTFRCHSQSDIETALEATAHLPWFAGQPVQLAEMMHLVDGGLSAGRVPLHEAIETGSTHILVLATDKSTAANSYKRQLREKVVARQLRKKYPVLSKNYWRGHDYHQEVLKLLDEGGNEDGPVIEVIRTPDQYIPSQTETNPTKLYTAAKAGEWAMMNVLKPYGLKRDPKVSVRPPRPHFW